MTFKFVCWSMELNRKYMTYFLESIFDQRWCRVVSPCVTRKARSPNPISAGHFGGRWLHTMTRLVTEPDLTRPYVVQCHLKSQNHCCLFLLSSVFSVPVAMGHADFTTLMLHGCQKYPSYLSLEGLETFQYLRLDNHKRQAV